LLETVLYSEVDIEEKLPHKKPFIFISGVTYLNVEKGKIRGFYNVDPRQFEGHIGKSLVFPKVLKEEAIAQLGAFLLRIQPKFANYIPIFSGSYKGKDHEMAIPGDRLDLELSMIEFDGRKSGRALGKAYIKNRLVHEYSFEFKIVKEETLYKLISKLEYSRKGGEKIGTVNKS